MREPAAAVCEALPGGPGFPERDALLPGLDRPAPALGGFDPDGGTGVRVGVASEVPAAAVAAAVS